MLQENVCDSTEWSPRLLTVTIANAMQQHGFLLQELDCYLFLHRLEFKHLPQLAREC